MTKPGIAVYKKWKIHQNTVYWANFEGCSEEGIDVLTNKTKRDRPSHNTLPAVCIEKVVVMNSGEELYNKVYGSPRSPQRIVLKPALHDGRQDTTPRRILESAGRPAAVKSNIGFKGYSILQFNKKITHERKQSKN